MQLLVSQRPGGASSAASCPFKVVVALDPCAFVDVVDGADNVADAPLEEGDGGAATGCGGIGSGPTLRAHPALAQRVELHTPNSADTPEGYELNTAEKSKGGREKLKQT